MVEKQQQQQPRRGFRGEEEAGGEGSQMEKERSAASFTTGLRVLGPPLLGFPLLVRLSIVLGFLLLLACTQQAGDSERIS